ncbi:hypothetical protein AXG93_4606s1040 [Marchantia polymorpha subsp. ruderalis]|uniref:Retrotransposon gag domain-containing protein n=1 Tax=Marchantia polymorpha subsp. ruderalis TaxID=1480154 RepID=A0A176VEP5_MARPO|nr:hypothetical protein AXG93_4606s1040 [Marchantia polymorpha subsp. ruderalis]
MKMNEDLEKEFTLSEEILEQVVTRVGGTVMEAEDITLPTSPVEEMRPEEGEKTSGKDEQLGKSEMRSEESQRRMQKAEDVYRQLRKDSTDMLRLRGGESPSPPGSPRGGPPFPPNPPGGGGGGDGGTGPPDRPMGDQQGNRQPFTEHSYPKYKEKGDDDADAYIKLFESVSIINKEDNEADRLRIFPSVLRKKAQSWYNHESTIPTGIDTWAKLREKFLKRFRELGYDSRVLTKLRNLHRERKDNLRDYTERFLGSLGSHPKDGRRSVLFHSASHRVVCNGLANGNEDLLPTL